MRLHVWSNGLHFSLVICGVNLSPVETPVVSLSNNGTTLIAWYISTGWIQNQVWLIYQSAELLSQVILNKIVEPIDSEIQTVTLPKIKQVFSIIVFFVLFHHNIAQPTKNKKLCQMFNKKPNRL